MAELSDKTKAMLKAELSADLVWATPHGEQLIVDMARVSVPGKEGQPGDKLIAYLLRHKHWSPFEMVNLCMEIRAPRDIGRQILRHSTLRPQEFSQRYADVNRLGAPYVRPARLQDETNRQNSLPCIDEELCDWWELSQMAVWNHASRVYNDAICMGIAKEVARAVMPEGMTPTRMFFNGPLRSWLHFCELRMGHGTQEEAVTIARQCWRVLQQHFPQVAYAFEAHIAGVEAP